MARYAADIETDGLLPELTQVHCAVLVDLDTGAVHDFADQPGHRGIDEFLQMARDAELLVFHNAIGFDIPALQKVYPGWLPKGQVLDTVILSRMAYPDIAKHDAALRAEKPSSLPGHLVGQHSLRAWGHRLGDHKDEYTGGWERWSPAMHSYMIQDGRLGARVYRHLRRKVAPGISVEVEHRFADYLRIQREQGFPFDQTKALELLAELVGLRDSLEEQLRSLYQPWWAYAGVFDFKKPRRAWVSHPQGSEERDGERGFWSQVWGHYTKIKYTEFNPQSRDHISDRLQKLRGWKPKAYGKNGKPTVDDLVIGALPFPEAPLLAKYLMVSKRIGQLSEGQEGWFRNVDKDGRLRGDVISIGTVTHRCAHRKPNLGQVPKVIKGKRGLEGLYGWECRSLFYAPEGYLLVGGDASGIEMRMLAHYLAAFDGGTFAKDLLEGDVHSKNQAAAGELCPNRDCAKTLLYAMLYGAGDSKLGNTVREYCIKLGLSAPKGTQLVIGKEVRKRLANAMVGMDPLTKALKKRAETGSLKGLDGRIIPIRSAHSALNTLLQSAGAIAFKHATVIFKQSLDDLGWQIPEDWWPAAHVHDEIQVITREELADAAGQALVAAIRAAGERLAVRCPLDGEFKIGRNWAGTH